MHADIERLPNQETMDDEVNNSNQETLEEIIESSPEIRKLCEVLVDPEFDLSDRQRIFKLFKGESTESVTAVLDAINGGEILDELEGILKLEKPATEDIERMRELVCPSGEGGLLIEPAAICKELGPDLIRRYFSFLDGRSLDKPYFFPSPMRDSQTEDYLRFEMNRDNPEGQAEYVEGFIKFAHSPEFLAEDGNAVDLATNLTISFARANPLHLMGAIARLNNFQLNNFYKFIRNKCSIRVIRIFEYLFGPERKKLMLTYVKHHEMKSRFTQTSLKKLHRRDKEIFDKC